MYRIKKKNLPIVVSTTLKLPAERET